MKKRVFAGVLCMLMVVLLLPVSAGAAGNVTISSINGKTRPNVIINTYSNTLSVPVIFQNNGTSTTLDTISYDENTSGITIDFTGSASIAADTATTVSLPITVSGDGLFATPIVFTFADGSVLNATLNIFKSSEASRDPVEIVTPTPTPTIEMPNILVLSPYGRDGALVEAPRGNYGDTVQVKLPIHNNAKTGSGYNASQITIRPILASTLDNFPFVIDSVDYSRSVPDIKPGETRDVTYIFRLSKEVTSGVKEVKFNCTYFNRKKNAYETSEFSVFVTVVKGKAAEDGSSIDKDSIVTTPKVIIESYSITPDNPQDGETDRLYAGEPFTLKMIIRNTSSDEAVKNIQISLSNEGGVVLPANNGSNTLYIDRINPGGQEERTVKLQSAPDADPKTQMLDVKFAYESAKTIMSYEVAETIAMPISQRIRVRVEEPIISEDAYMDQAVYTSVRMFNMGKSSLYNCMIDVEGEGLKLEESYYGGTIGGGQTMYADLGIISSNAGQIEGTIVITFEDAYGEVTRMEEPFTMNVIDMNAGMDMMGEGEMYPGMEGMGGLEEYNPEGSAGLPTWAIIAIIAACVGALIAIVIVLRRRHRKKELTEGA